MKETLKINNFGPIKDVDLDLKKVNVFIGDQGTGKSTVAKLLSVMKLFTHFSIFYQDEPTVEQSHTWQFNQYLKQFELDTLVNSTTSIFYSNGDFKIHFEKGECNKSLVDNSIFRAGIVNYIIAERSMVSMLENALFAIIEVGAKLPTLFNRFGIKYNKARTEINRGWYKNILGVDFRHNKGIDYVYDADVDLNVPLKFASSGIQGTIPLLVLLESVVEKIHLGGRFGLIKDNFLVIEEPEINLFPSTQNKLLKHIIKENIDVQFKEEVDENGMIRYDEKNPKRYYKNQLLITTHSPYILSSLNNLMYAFLVGTKNDKLISVDKIIESKCWLNPNDVTCYLLKNGTYENIMDKESGLIDTLKIDDASDIINEEFDKLMAIELETEN